MGRRRDEWHAKRDGKILNLHLQGLDHEQLAERFHICASRIAQIVSGTRKNKEPGNYAAYQLSFGS